MIEPLQILGSFATIWLVTWLGFSLLLAALHPVLRSWLRRLHPALAGDFLLLSLAFPVVTSLLSTLLLFTPFLLDDMVRGHCHEECTRHFPLVSSGWLYGTGLALIATALLLTGHKLLHYRRLSARLMHQMNTLGRDMGKWILLPNDDNMVFALGWWRSRIYITRGLLERCGEREVRIILAHEEAHVRRRDNIRLVLGKLFLSVLPGRLARSLHADLHLFCESACDFAAADRHAAVDVASVLVNVQRLMARAPAPASESLLGFGGAEIEQRVKYLLSSASGRRQPTPLPALATVLLLIGLAVSLVDPLHHLAETLLGG